MSRYLFPIGTFVGGQLLCLGFYLFLSTINSNVNTLATDTAGIASTFWGWSWLMTNGVVVGLIIVFLELMVLFITAKAFMAVKE